MASARIAALIRASDFDGAAIDPVEDLRGVTVADSQGRDVGKVTDLMLDQHEHHVRFLVVTAGGFLGLTAHRFVIPVDAVVGVTDGTVHIERTREDVSAAPPYDRELAGDAAYCAGIYGWYGYLPFWHPEYVYPSERFTNFEE